MPRKIIDYLKDIRKVLELAEKPEGEEFKHIFRLVLLGFFIIGVLSFGIVMLISSLLAMYNAGLQS